MSQSKRPRPQSPSHNASSQDAFDALEDNGGMHAISASAVISDRESHFIGLFSPSAPLSELRRHPQLQGADHCIAGWRKAGTQRSVLPGASPPLDTGYDDDGEARAGRRVLSVLESLHVQGTVVVGRWWGGIMLGPVRFTHIESVAKQAVLAAQGKGDGGRLAKKVKTDTDKEAERKEEERNEKERKRLIDVLPTRDAHITILRALLAEKKQLLANTPASQQESPRAAPKVQYAAMQLVVLKRLENARDKTIAFVLAEIEKVEAQLENAGKPGGTQGTKPEGHASASMSTSAVAGAKPAPTSTTTTSKPDT